MDFEKIREEKQARFQQLVAELNRLKLHERQITDELLRLEGELRLLDEILRKDEEGMSDGI